MMKVYGLCLRFWGKVYKKVYVTVVTVIALLHIHSIMVVNTPVSRLSAVEIGQSFQATKTSVKTTHSGYQLSVLDNETIKPVKDKRELSLERSAKFSVVTNRTPMIANKPLQGQVCQQSFEHVEKMVNPKTTTNRNDWRFIEKHKCPTITLKKGTTAWNKVILNCKTGQPKLSTMPASSSSDVTSVPHNDSCLKSYLQNCCRGKNLVPNVAHYIWIGSKELGFFQFVSFMSVLRFSKPCLFLFHGGLPHGDYWDYFRTLVPNIIHVNRTAVEYIYGQKLKFVEHSADVMRIEAVLAFGGFYMDWDEILLKPVDDLRDYKCTMSQTVPNLMTIGFIMGEMNSTFLNLWHQGYKDYRTGWAYNSLKVPYDISQKHPNTVHIAGYKFVRPSFREMGKIFYKNYDWSDNYGIHLYIRYYKKPTDINRIRTLNNTIGAVCRHALFGNKELCLN